MTIHTRFLGAAAAVALLLPTAAFAADGFYLGGNVGLSIPGSAQYDSGAVSNDVDTDIGFAGLLTGGYQLENNWRFEGELGARLANQVGDISGTGSGPTEKGNINVYSLMANAIYGIPTGTKFTPYVGAGAGVARVSANNIRTLFSTSVDDSDTAFAYQGILGMEYDISDSLKAGLDYRYFRTADLKFSDATATAVKADYENHTVTMGVRYLFPAPAPMLAAPVAAPAVAEAVPAAPTVPNNYIVFFDFDRAQLTADAQRIVTAAAQNAQQAQATRIEVTGHADRSGSDKYNQRLSQRRAAAVKKALLDMGIPADQIAVQAVGESQPLVPTADGVREAQNRRVQIVLK